MATGDKTCERCRSRYRADFGSEMCIHIPGIENLTVPHVIVFPTLSICLECGCISGFAIPEEQLRQLRKYVRKGSPEPSADAGQD